MTIVPLFPWLIPTRFFKLLGAAFDRAGWNEYTGQRYYQNVIGRWHWWKQKKKRKGSNLGPHLWKLKYSIGNKEEGYGRLFIHVQTTLVRQENIHRHTSRPGTVEQLLPALSGTSAVWRKPSPMLPCFYWYIQKSLQLAAFFIKKRKIRHQNFSAPKRHLFTIFET